MPYPIYEYVICLVVNLPIRRGSGVFMNVSVWEHLTLNNLIFDVAKFTVHKHHYHYYPDVDCHSQFSV